MRPKTWKEWEKPLLELEEALDMLERLLPTVNDQTRRGEIEGKIKDYAKRRDRYIANKYSNLDPWEKVLVARAEPRPYTLDYISAILTDFTELQGDRRFGADNAIIGGPARLDGRPVMVIGHQKGRNIQERQHRNFAMSKPEGYRKAIRLMEMADRFGLPVLTFIDTPAADPGVESEARGISEAIAAAILAMFELRVPVVATIIGEGGSGGAIGIGVGNTVLMQEHAIYSVIPPEGCAAILWRQPEKGPEAAEALRLTASSAKDLGLVDSIVPEPFGGAHRNPMEAADQVKSAIVKSLDKLTKLSGDKLRKNRYDKFRKLGIFGE